MFALQHSKCPLPAILFCCLWSELCNCVCLANGLTNSRGKNAFSDQCTEFVKVKRWTGKLNSVDILETLSAAATKTAKRSVTQSLRSLVNFPHSLRISPLRYPYSIVALHLLSYVACLSFADELIRLKRSKKRGVHFLSLPRVTKECKVDPAAPSPSLITVLGRADCDWMPFLLHSF